ncbi:MAG: lytic murein transglycosylase [Solirubrobacterales bacterium]|jgi:hypothetical protein|nr:lytic murein transglycosylase [Solirubrobacterales bacterium]
MRRRKLLTLLATAGICTAGYGAAAAPASAELRSLRVTLADGQQVTLTVDVPPGTPVEAVPLPGITAPVARVEDLGSAVLPSPTPSETSPTPPASTPIATPHRKPNAQGRTYGERNRTRRRRANAQGKSEAVVAPVEPRRRAAPAPTPGPQPDRNANGTPTQQNPGLSLASPGAAPIGVPNFFIDKFRIPPFLLPIYQAAGMQYGVRWEVLAAINEIETDYGRNLNVSTAGALGWMQFLPSTWKLYGVDGNRDGAKDPYNPVDAIFGAARYLRAAGAEKDLSRAVFAYNHADWYVDSVLMRARLIGGLPSNLVGSLTGLTQARFPVHAKASYADDLSERQLRRRRKQGQNAAYLIESSQGRRGINVYARAGAPVIAANDGRIVRIGRTERLGRFLQLQDAYGNTFTYGRLGSVAERYPALKPRKVTSAEVASELKLPRADRKPSVPATAGTRKPGRRGGSAASSGLAAKGASPQSVRAAKERLFAHPRRPNAHDAGGAQQIIEAGGKVAGITTVRSLSGVFGLDRRDIQLKPLKVGSKVAAGTILGRIRRGDGKAAPHVLFEIRPAGRGAPRVDPKPILDGWKLLESTAIYRARGRNPFVGPDAAHLSIGQILLMSKEELAQRVAANPRIELYECGRRDVLTGQIDRRVLATLEYLAASGLKPTVTSLRCGHGYLTASGNVSHHSSGNAVDIAKVNGIPIQGHQGAGSITELTIQRLLTLQGSLQADQIISLMTFDGADNTLAMADHADHIHVGWRPLYGTNTTLAKQVSSALKPSQWRKLIDRLSRIDNPRVRTTPSSSALQVRPRRSSRTKG